MNKEHKHSVFLEIPQEKKEFLEVLAKASKMTLEEYVKWTLDKFLEPKEKPVVKNCSTCVHSRGKDYFKRCELFQYFCSIALNSCCHLEKWQAKDSEDQNSPLKNGFWGSNAV